MERNTGAVKQSQIKPQDPKQCVLPALHVSLLIKVDHRRPIVLNVLLHPTPPSVRAPAQLLAEAGRLHCARAADPTPEAADRAANVDGVHRVGAAKGEEGEGEGGGEQDEDDERRRAGGISEIVAK